MVAGAAGQQDQARTGGLFLRDAGREPKAGAPPPDVRDVQAGVRGAPDTVPAHLGDDPHALPLRQLLDRRADVSDASAIPDDGDADVEAPSRDPVYPSPSPGSGSHSTPNSNSIASNGSARTTASPR